MYRHILLTVMLIFAAALNCFGQTAVLRDYVGMISQTFHPDVVTYLQEFQRKLDKRSYAAAAKAIDIYLKGDSGTGFVYVANDGQNYILTNYHVISQAITLSVTFEKQDGEQSKFSDLIIVAADEDMDIALLTFAGGQKPFKQGLAFLSRPVEEGDDVFSAGFPQAGTAMIWQLGRGMISNAMVRLPQEDGNNKRIGPYIQHTAQIDPGNSGGPLLVQIQGVPAGYAVAGINTLSYRGRQAANYSIPLSRVQSFLDASLKPKLEEKRARLDARLASFIDGLGASKAVYPHIAAYLSNDCTGENAEFALSEMIEKAPKTVSDDIVHTFAYSPVDGMAHAVAWTIENTLRFRSGKITVSVDTVSENGANGYTVSFNVNDKIISSEWINEYGIWRIKTFGDFASGDKTLIKKKAEAKAASDRLRANPDMQISGGFVWITDYEAGFGADIVFRLGNYLGSGVRGFFARGFIELDITGGVYIPIKLGSVALTPYGNIGVGFHLKEPLEPSGDRESSGLFNGRDLDFGIPIHAGLQFTTTAVPGLFLQTAYQYNAFNWLGLLEDSGVHAVFVSIGYSF